MTRKDTYQLLHEHSQFWYERFALWILLKKLMCEEYL